MNTQELIKIEDDYFINTFTRQPAILDHGEGVKVTDIDGNEYLDMFAGIAVNALGHNHPKLVKAIQDQAEKLIHVSSIYYNEPALVYAKKLIDKTSFDRIFYANSGAEANEGAIKLAVKYTGKSEVISTVESFHGRTIMTLAATGHEHYHEPFKAILPKGFINVPYNDIEAIKDAITENTAAIIVEPIQGEGGVNIPDKDYLKQIEEICHEKDIVFIVDEVQTGFGRCGSLFQPKKWPQHLYLVITEPLSAEDLWSVQPQMQFWMLLKKRISWTMLMRLANISSANLKNWTRKSLPM